MALPVADRNVTADLTEVEELITIPTFMSNNTTLVDARIATTDTLQVVNGLFCQIANLEVYRGSRLSIMISHNGFSLSTRGTLEVIKWSNVAISLHITLYFFRSISETCLTALMNTRESSIA